MIVNARDVVGMIESDPHAMRILRAAAELDLPDWWIGAGFVRNRVWDTISGSPALPERDVDVAYFNPLHPDKSDRSEDVRAETQAATILPGVPWEIRNQARMHLHNGEAPYTSTQDAISRWPETATCVAVTLRENAVHLLTCHGIEDLVQLVVRPSPTFDTPEGREKVRQRAKAKGWATRWPGLRLEW